MERDGLKLPDFVIGGAPRSGTTWLWHVLSHHPKVHMAGPITPEPKYFLVDDTYAKGLGHYSRTWFESARPGQILGEKSTNYLESRTCAERIRAALPAAKLIFILREPAERAYSNWLWSRQNGLETESFARALELEAERERALPERLRFARPYAYFSRGLYADLLEVYLSLFHREQILCLKFEDVSDDAPTLATRIHRFLGVEPRPGDADGLGVINASEKGAHEERMPEDARHALLQRYVEPNRRLTTLLGPGFQLWESE